TSPAHASGGCMNVSTTDMGLLAFESGAMCFDPARISHPDPSLFDPDNPALEAVPVAVGGRQSAWFVSGDVGPAVLRHYRRGGLAARVSRDRYLWAGPSSTRSFAEFRVLRGLYERGLRVPAPLAGAYWRSGP